MKSMLKSLMSVAVAALAFTSCSTDATDEVIAKNEPKTLKVTATIDQTRTTLAGDHVKLNWSDDDVILFYIGEEATTFNKINPSTGGTVKDVVYENGNNVYANYSIENEKYSKEGVRKAQINIKNAQTQSEASVFAGENLPMIAQSTIKDGAVNLTFKPFGCVLVFNVYGSTAGEKVESIKFDPGVPCCGYQNCDLTIGASDYIGLSYRTSATVTLTTPAAIGTAKPEDTKINENQVYLVVAPFNYTAATFTVKTDANKTYTFVTKSGIDCSQNTARVVNLNLTKSAEMQPSIEVPTVDEQPSAGVAELVIEPIVFNNITETAQVNVYSDKNLTASENVGWLTIVNDTELSANGKLYCKIEANEGDARTAYIGIVCGNVKEAIAITQLAKGVTISKIEMSADDIYANHTGKEIGNGNYKIDGVEQNVDTPSTYYTWQMGGVNFGGARICKSTSKDYNNLILGLLQMQGSATDKTKQGFFGNVDDLTKISKVVIVSKNNNKAPTEHLYVGTSAYTRGQNAVKVEPVLQTDGNIYTETFNINGDYGFFTVSNDTGGAMYIESVTVYYSAE